MRSTPPRHPAIEWANRQGAKAAKKEKDRIVSKFPLYLAFFASWRFVRYFARLQQPQPLQAQGFSQPQAGAHRHPAVAPRLQAQAAWLQLEQAQSALVFVVMRSSLFLGASFLVL